MLLKEKADHIVLYNISWEQFENLLKDLGESRGVRIAYDEGTLEIMTPLPEHEYYKDSISDAVKDIAEELAINYECYGSTTWKKELKSAGVEADNCFYFQNEAKVRGKLEINLNEDPPPDLALEIDLTHKSLNRFPIYARLGVPELWCFDQGKLQIYQLEGGEYKRVENSAIFPQIPIQELPNLIERNRSQGRRAIRQIVREWVNNLKL